MVGIPRTSIWSFTSTGTQWSGPRGFRSRSAWSSESAIASARGFTVWMLFSAGPCLS